MTHLQGSLNLYSLSTSAKQAHISDVLTVQLQKVFVPGQEYLSNDGVHHEYAWINPVVNARMECHCRSLYMPLWNTCLCVSL